MSSGSNPTPSAQAPIKPPEQIDFPGFQITGADTLVDIGCGDGTVCAYAGQQGAGVIGIDVEETLIASTTQRMKDIPARSFKGIVSMCNPIPLPDATGTVIVCTEVLEHVDDPKVFMRELARIGAPGARYLFSVPHEGVENVMQEVSPEWYRKKPLHIRVFATEDFLSLVRSQGLDVMLVTSSGYFWSIWWFLRISMGMSHPYEERPEHPAWLAWDVVAQTLVLSKDGDKFKRFFNRQFPKSLVVIARKPVPGEDGVFGGLKKWFRNTFRRGTLSLGNYELDWTFRQKR